jgi:hypothetical protein
MLGALRRDTSTAGCAAMIAVTASTNVGTLKRQRSSLALGADHTD